VAVATALATQERGKDSPDPAGGASSAATRSSSASAGPTPAPAPADGDAPAIALGARVPAEGFIELGIGEERRYRLHLDSERAVYVHGHVCTDLVSWQLFRRGGPLVSRGTLGCRQSGPYALTAGDYELLVGGRDVDGTYALTVGAR
jgi:hypothetical protein